MIEITDKSKCCGCWACENTCPKNCITMVEDEEGFRYPQIDKDVCIDCGLCEKVCPLKQPRMDDATPDSYVVQQKDKEILRSSTSGGFFSSIAKWAIAQGGVVFGAAFDEDMELRHSYSETLEGCAKFRGSKYVQSLIGDSYKNAKNFLAQGRVVVFSGTPCQISGLFHYLRGKKYEGLVTVDLVCRGTPSPLLLRKYLNYHSSRLGAKAVDYRSRHKYLGYYFSTASIFFDNKKIKYNKSKESDLMIKLYFDNLISRPSCYKCHFKALHRVSDITIFDCWDAMSVSSEFTDGGATNVFLHTEKGRTCFNEIKHEFVCKASEINSIIARDGVMIKNCVPLNPHREAFFHDLQNMEMEELEQKYMGGKTKRNIIAKLKLVLWKLGLFKPYLLYKIRHTTPK